MLWCRMQEVEVSFVQFPAGQMLWFPFQGGLNSQSGYGLSQTACGIWSVYAISQPSAICFMYGTRYFFETVLKILTGSAGVSPAMPCFRQRGKAIEHRVVSVDLIP